MHSKNKFNTYLARIQSIPCNGIFFVRPAATAVHGKKLKCPVAGSSKGLVTITMAVIIKPTVRTQGFMMSRVCTNTSSPYRRHGKVKI